jgi:hypothetical protein
MARLYSNENFPLPVVEGLRRLGHDVLTSYEAGKSGQAIPDEEVIELARIEKRALLTMNRKHFVRLHLKNPDHSGVVVCTFDSEFNALSIRLHTSIESLPTLSGQLIRINRPPT